MYGKRYLALALLASALWGVTYPLTYIALRLVNALELIMLTYFVTVVVLTPMVLIKGFDSKSLMKGLILSLINYPVVYLYIVLSGDIGGFTAFVSAMYVVPLIFLEYLRIRRLNIQYLLSSSTMLLGLYILFGGSVDGFILPALSLLVLNFAYLIIVEYLGDYDEINVAFGQSLGTLAIAIIITSFYGVYLTINTIIIGYSVLLSILGNAIPSILYILAIKRVGAVSVSLTSSAEILASLALSIFTSPIPINPIAWLLLSMSLVILVLLPFKFFSDEYVWSKLAYHTGVVSFLGNEFGKVYLPIVDEFINGSII